MAKESSSNGLEKRPKLRFPGFDEPWKVVALGNILQERNEYSEKDGSYEHATLSKEGIYGKTARYDRDFLVSTENKKYKVTHYNDLCYNPANLKFGVICLNKYGDAIFSPIYITFEIDEEVDVDFLGANLTRWDFINRALRFQQGTVYERMAVSPDDFLSIQCYLPSKAEQICISSFVQSLNKRIDKQEKLVEALKKYKRGVVSKVFSEFERECKTIRLGDCVSILRGGSPRPIDAYITDDPDGINWIKIGDTSADELYITRTREKIIPSGVKKSRRVFQGDLILSNSMSFGRPYILQIDGCIHDGWLLIRDEDNVFEKRFLCYYLGSNNVIAQYKRLAAGSCVNNLNSELVGNVEICCPPHSTQQEIADMLTVLDLRIAHTNRTYEALLRMRTSLMQQLFI